MPTIDTHSKINTKTISFTRDGNESLILKYPDIRKKRFTPHIKKGIKTNFNVALGA